MNPFLVVLNRFRSMDFSRYELLMMYTIYFLTMVIRNSIFMFPIFANITPEWSCDGGRNFSKSCEVYYNCTKGNLNATETGIIFRAPFTGARQEFGLICDRAYLAAMMTSLQFAGVLLGTSSIGYISDRFGRRKVLIVTIWLEIASTLASSFATGSVMLTVFRFIAGYFTGGDLVITYTFAIEVIKPQQRMFLNTFLSYPLCSLFSLGICYLVGNWRSMIQIVSFAAVPVPFLLMFLVPESVKWATDRGRPKRAAKAQTRIDAINNYKPCSCTADTTNSLENTDRPYEKNGKGGLDSDSKSALNTSELENLRNAVEVTKTRIGNVEVNYNGSNIDDASELNNGTNGSAAADTATENLLNVNEKSVVVVEPSTTHKKHSPLLDMIRTPAMRWKTLLMCDLWFSVAVSSFTIAFDSRNLAGDFYVNQMLFSTVSMIANLTTFTLDTFMPGFSRRVLHQVPLTVVITIAATIGILYTINNDGSISALNTTAIVLSLAAVLCSSPIWDAVYLCTAELFPTEARTSAYGLCNVFARFGAMIAPQLVLLRDVWNAGPYFLIAGLNIVAFIMSYKILPDTKNKELPSDVKQADAVRSASMSA